MVDAFKLRSFNDSKKEEKTESALAEGWGNDKRDYVSMTLKKKRRLKGDGFKPRGDAIYSVFQ